MEFRRLGKTGYEISAIGFGAWAIGADWGSVNDVDSLAALHAAADAGVNFIDTADAYGDGRSERVISRFLKERGGERIYVATKMGRRTQPIMENLTPEAFIAWTSRSRDNLDTETLDLVQVHCPPTEFFYHPELFAAMDELVAAGVMRHYGVSVEKVEQAIKAVEYPGVASVQIIFNMVRQRPADRFLAQALDADVGVLARVPLASGLLTGKYDRDSTFAENDHRNYNREGQAFDVGETFAGLDYEAGLDFVAAVTELVPPGATLSQFALRWILMQEGVTAAIPGAKTSEQARGNAAAADLAPLPPEVMAGVRESYERYAKELVHQRW
jgi:aryl-alcohol dehydrogenase-like predicted oxidoreductase